MTGQAMGGPRALPATVPKRRKRVRVVAAAAGVVLAAAVAAWAAIRPGTAKPGDAAEPAGRQSPEDQEKAAFDTFFEEARQRQVHEVVAEPDAMNSSAFTITRYETRGEYLVTTVFDCYVSGGEGWVKSRTISVLGRDMQPVGKPHTVDRIFLSFAVETDDQGKVKIPELLDDLADGAVTLAWNDDAVDRQVKEAGEYARERKAKAAARAAEYARRAKGGD